MTENITLTDAAARRIAHILSMDSAKNALRVSVEGGGCSGFSYKFDLVEEGLEDDLVLEKDKARRSISSMT